MRPPILLLILALAGCQSAAKRDALLLRDRVTKLQPLSSFAPRVCRLEATLTQPAVSRYRALFPADEKQLRRSPWVYRWRAREGSCEVTPESDTPSTRNQRSFLNTAVCLLLQVHWVNSPFDELKISPDDLEGDEGAVHIREAAAPGLGIYLPRDRFVIETRTKTRGTLRAEYAEADGQWLPTRLEQRLGDTVFTLEELEWQPARPGERRALASFWIFIGDDGRPLRHSQVRLAECRPD